MTKRKLFGNFPANYSDLHALYEMWYEMNDGSSFGQWINDNYARTPWRELDQQRDNWHAYSMIADLYK